MPKVSVIIPVYNVEDYLCKCLNTVTNQTLKEIEIICIDDKSTDNSLEILKEFAQKDNRIKIIEQEVNQGQGVARNIGINVAKGEYIGFVDPDDWIEVDMFEKMYNQAKELHSEIVVCDYLDCNFSKKKYQISPYFQEYTNLKKRSAIKNIKKGVVLKDVILRSLLCSPCYSWNKIFYREFLVNNAISFAKNRCFEDCIFILKSFTTAKTVSYIDEALYFYRRNETSTLRSNNERYLDFIDTYNILKDFIKNNSNKKILEQNFHFFALSNGICTYKNLPEDYRVKFYKKCKENFEDKEIKLLKKTLHISKLNQLYKFIQFIFQIYNEQDYKIIKVLGYKFRKYT